MRISFFVLYIFKIFVRHGLANRYYSDAFAAGFISGVVEGKDVDESVDRGQWLAALGIKELGPQLVAPSQSPQVIGLIFPSRYPFPKQSYQPQKAN